MHVGNANLELDEKGSRASETLTILLLWQDADSGIARVATAGEASYSRLPVERRYYNSLQPWLYYIYIVDL